MFRVVLDVLNPLTGGPKLPVIAVRFREKVLQRFKAVVIGKKHHYLTHQVAHQIEVMQPHLGCRPDIVKCYGAKQVGPGAFFQELA